jgi:ATP synthase protein I
VNDEEPGPEQGQEQEHEKMEAEASDGMIESVRRARDRQIQQREDEPSMMRFVGQIGVLGWIIVTPILVGLFIGRWIDAKLGTGIFWSAPLMFVGVVIGCWSAWKWMYRQ